MVEDFKLDTGTFVHVGSLRVASIAAAAPAIQDAVVCGHDRAYVGLLAWPNLAACRELCTDPAAKDNLAGLLRSPAVIEHVRASLQRYNQKNPGSSTRVARVLLMSEPPSIDGNEITDKGYINQRAALDRRAPLVEKLFAEPPSDDVIVI